MPEPFASKRTVLLENGQVAVAPTPDADGSKRATQPRRRRLATHTIARGGEFTAAPSGPAIAAAASRRAPAEPDRTPSRLNP